MTNTNELTPSGSNSTSDTRPPATKPNRAPTSQPRSKPTQATTMSAKSGLAPRMRTFGATVVCSSAATSSAAHSRSMSSHTFLGAGATASVRATGAFT